MAATRIEGIEEFQGLEGKHLGHSAWLEVTQARVNDFADATLDHQWIHVDVERAKKESPFGAPIAHGYLTLSLVPHLYHEVIDVTGVKMVVNYGLNKLRYPAPVKVGDKIRLGLEIAQVEAIPGGVQCVMKGTMETEGGEKPAMVAELVYRYYG